MANTSSRFCGKFGYIIGFMICPVCPSEDKQAPRGRETLASFKKRLRRTALAFPTADVRKMAQAMWSRAKAIIDAKGNDIARD